MSASRSFLAKNRPQLITLHWQYCWKRAHRWAVSLSDHRKKKRSTWTSRPSRACSATQLITRARRRRSQAKASSRCLRRQRWFFRSLSSRLQLILFLCPHAPIFRNKPSGCSRSVLGSTNFVGTRRNWEEEEEEVLASRAALSSWLSCSFLLSAHPNVIVHWALHLTYSLWRSWRCYRISFSFIRTLIAWQSALILLSLLPYCFALILWKIVRIDIFIVILTWNECAWQFFFLPQDGVKTPSSTKSLRELLETPKWLWW